jgi:hypothetical protein
LEHIDAERFNKRSGQTEGESRSFKISIKPGERA